VDGGDAAVAQRFEIIAAGPRDLADDDVLADGSAPGNAAELYRPVR
jgi:hypothetical protein